MTLRIGPRLWGAGALLLGVLGLIYLGGSPSRAVHADGVPFQVGDVFAGIGSGLIRHHRPDGTAVDVLDTTSSSLEDTGMCFDVAGNLFATDFTARVMTKFNNQGNLVSHPFAQGFNVHPESCVFDAAGNMYTGEVDAPGEESNYLRKFDSNGQQIASWTPQREVRGIDWIDLAADQCTIFYTSEGYSIWRFNVCTGTQLPNFHDFDPADNDGVSYAVRIRPDGTVMVAREYALYHLAADGSVIRRYPAPAPPRPDDFLFAMNLDPDGQTFWTGGYFSGRIYRIRFDDPCNPSCSPVTEFASTISPPPAFSMAGLAVYGNFMPRNPRRRPHRPIHQARPRQRAAWGPPSWGTGTLRAAASRPG